MATVIREAQSVEVRRGNIACVSFLHLLSVDPVKYRLIKLDLANINHTSKNPMAINNTGTVCLLSGEKRCFLLLPPPHPVIFLEFQFLSLCEVELFYKIVQVNSVYLPDRCSVAGMETQQLIKVNISAAVKLILRLTSNKDPDKEDQHKSHFDWKPVKVENKLI